MMGKLIAEAIAFKVLGRGLPAWAYCSREVTERMPSAPVLQFCGERSDFGGVVATRSSEDGHFALGDFEGDLDDAKMLGVSERGLSPVVPQGTRKLMPASI